MRLFLSVAAAVLMLGLQAGVRGAEESGAATAPAAAEKPEGSDASKDKVAAAANAFAADLFAQMRGREGNLFFSPYSVCAALSMVREGAAGKTAEEMTAVLHLPAAEDVHRGFKDMHEVLQAEKSRKGYELTVANAVWADAGTAFLPAYLDQLKASFGATAEEVPFAQSAQAAATINGWVKKQTAEKITSLVSPTAFTKQTRMVLTNAVYFKGEWSSQFQPGQTSSGDFTTAKAKVRAPMMHQTQTLGYAEGKTPGGTEYQALRMDYIGDKVAMTVVLPKGVGDLAALEGAFDKALCEKLMRLGARKVIVTFPKFKMTDQLDLGEKLQALGMKAAFGPTADFSGMSGRKDLLLSKVLHKSYVDVNEKGTEAAAVTGAEMMTLGVGARPPQPPKFTADHPFLFFIWDTQMRTVLFVGRVADPTK
jgi:serpin B